MKKEQNAYIKDVKTCFPVNSTDELIRREAFAFGWKAHREGAYK